MNWLLSLERRSLVNPVSPVHTNASLLARQVSLQVVKHLGDDLRARWSLQASRPAFRLPSRVLPAFGTKPSWKVHAGAAGLRDNDSLIRVNGLRKRRTSNRGLPINGAKDPQRCPSVAVLWKLRVAALFPAVTGLRIPGDANLINKLSVPKFTKEARG